jgi:hypothetical protein
VGPERVSGERSQRTHRVAHHPVDEGSVEPSGEQERVLDGVPLQSRDLFLVAPQDGILSHHANVVHFYLCRYELSLAEVEGREGGGEADQVVSGSGREEGAA